VIEPASEEVLETGRNEFGQKEQRLRETVEHLKDWIQLQPNLPQNNWYVLAKTVNVPTVLVTVNTLSLVEIT